jgi:hypothetical protein
MFDLPIAVASITPWNVDAIVAGHDVRARGNQHVTRSRARPALLLAGHEPGELVEQAAADLRGASP